MNKNTTRYYELDLLRFIAAMAVVLFHFMFRGQQGDFIPVSFPSFENYVQYGYLGVNLFFMISGFVISLSAENRTARQFVISRITRLYPAFWAGVTVTAIAIVFFGGTLFQVDWSQYLINLTMLAQFLGVENVDGVYWTLYVELKFYVIIFIVLLFDKFNKMELVLATWLSILLLGLAFELPRIVNSLVFSEWAPFFISGVVFYLLKVKGFNLLRSAILIVAFMLSLLEAVEGNTVFNTDYNVNASELAVVLIVLSYYCTFTLIIFDKLSWFRSSWALRIGALTYPLYLIHQNLGFMFFTYFDGVLNKYVLLMMAILLVLVISWLIHVLIERKLGPEFKRCLEGCLSVKSENKEPNITHKSIR